MRYCAPVPYHWILVREEVLKSYVIRCYYYNELLLYFCYVIECGSHLCMEQGPRVFHVSSAMTERGERKWKYILSISNFHRKYFKSHLNELLFIRYQTRTHHAFGTQQHSLCPIAWRIIFSSACRTISKLFIYFANDSLAIYIYIYWHIVQWLFVWVSIKLI